MMIVLLGREMFTSSQFFVLLIKTKKKKEEVSSCISKIVKSYIMHNHARNRITISR